MLPAEILKKVRRLELKTKKLVNNIFAGEYHTAFKGQGMTFAEFREYVPGDDVRSISWTVTARTGKTFIKKYDEEREMTLMLVVDISGSSDFGSGEYFKGEIMTHVSALLAFAATQNKDQVGLLLFSDQVEHFVPPKKGQGHVQRILRDLYYVKPKSHGTRLSVAIQYLQGLLKKKSVIILISDFMDENYDSHLRRLGQKHEVLAVVVSDPLETAPPDIGVVQLQDAETGQMMLVDTSSAEFKKNWSLQRNEQIERRDKMLKQAQVDRVNLSTAGDFADDLIKFFKLRR
jgi:uncharacterized protein (DUF58 family)